MKPPFLLFLANVQDVLAAKTAIGLVHWRRADCIAQFRMPGCEVSTGLPDATVHEAVQLGAKTFVIGVTSRGGRIDPEWHPHIRAAIDSGLDVANGLHDRLHAVDQFVDAARRVGASLLDLRHHDAPIPMASGRKRQGRRLLTVGTDCSCGKKFTALTIARDMTAQGVDCTFRATGQTGIMISGSGLALDTVIGDFIAGGAEWLSPDNSREHWDVIEGQGSILHPAHAGVPLSLLHGSQPDAFVVCHEPTRRHMRGITHPIPSIAAVRDATETMGRVTNPEIRCVGISLNTSEYRGDPSQLKDELCRLHGVPVVDPVRDGTAAILRHMCSLGLLPR